MIKFYDYIKPIYFIYILTQLWFLLLLLKVILLTIICYFVTIVIKEDFQQSQNYNIIYIHVPSAWISLLLYSSIALISLFYLIYKYSLISSIAKILAIIGINFSLITLITGSIWGKPTWGHFWVWDARLTSALILFILYLGYIIIYDFYDNIIKTNSSVLAILGFINIPIIKYSVYWWNTLHQSSSISINQSTLDLPIMYTLFISLLFFILYSINIFLFEIKKYFLLYKIETFYIK